MPIVRARRDLVLATLTLALAACGDGAGKLPDAPPGGGGTPLANAVAIAAGHDFACAVLGDHSVRCWGANDNGELGGSENDPTLHCDSIKCSTAVAVPTVTTATSVAAGLGAACVLLADQTVACWGDNTNGQLGDGSNTSSSSPVAVSQLAGVTAISAGDQTMCALEMVGGMACWGANVHGQVGNNSTTNALTPAVTMGLSSVTAISAGDGRACAVTGGGLDCWGDNNLGELGLGNTNESYLPVAVPGVTGAIAASAGGFMTCVLVGGGKVTCWGDNSNGQLGTGASSATPVASPGAMVSGLSNATAISAARDGGNFVCALLTDHTVTCWGSNQQGQLGNGSTTDSAAPVAVTGLSGVTAIASGDTFACAMLGDGSVKCWGDNNDAQLGDGSTASSSSPVAVIVKP